MPCARAAWSTSALRSPRCTAAAESRSGSVTDTPAPRTDEAGTWWAKALSAKVRPNRASTFAVPLSDSVAVREPVTRRSAVTPPGRPVTEAAPVRVRLVPLRAANRARPSRVSLMLPSTVPSAAVFTVAGRAETTVSPLPVSVPPPVSPPSVFSEYAGLVSAPHFDGLAPMVKLRVPPEMICE